MIIYPIGVAVPPEHEPVTVDEAKQHLRVDITDDDSLILSQITSARISLEDMLGRKFVTQTCEQIADTWPVGDAIRLRVAPVQSITSISWFDNEDNETVIDSAMYYLTPGNRIQLRRGMSWPSAEHRPAAAITYTFVAGYGESVLVPQPIKQAILLMIGDLYENREATILGSIRTSTPKINYGVEALTGSFIYRWGV